MDPDTTVLHLKNKVFDKTAFPVHSFKLNLGRFAVSDNDTLTSLALKFGTNDFEFKIDQQGVQGGMPGTLQRSRSTPTNQRSRSSPTNRDTANLAAALATVAAALVPEHSPSAKKPRRTPLMQVGEQRDRTAWEQRDSTAKQHSETELSGPESDDCGGDELVREEKMVRVCVCTCTYDTGSGDERRVVRPTIKRRPCWGSRKNRRFVFVCVHAGGRGNVC